MSIVTFVLIAVVLFFSRHELVHAWHVLAHVDAWILLLMIPVQGLVYYAGGEMLFSYLRSKDAIKELKPLTLARLSLEMNFVNHVFPSGGVSGISYMNWRLGIYGVTGARATLAQVVRYSMGFVAFIVLLGFSVIAVTVDGSINRWIIFASSILVGAISLGLLAVVFLVSNKHRLEVFGSWLVRTVNRIVRKLTLGHRHAVLKGEMVDAYFNDLHYDYLALMHDKRILIKPFLWGLVYTLGDVLLFMIAFWALGMWVNPAPILIAYGIAALAGLFVLTPGGAGAYEAIMIAVLTVSGIPQGVALAGILLARVVLLIGTIVMGYLFYQHAILKYGHGKPPTISQ